MCIYKTKAKKDLLSLWPVRLEGVREVFSVPQSVTMELLDLSTVDLDEDYTCGRAPQMFTGCGISPDGVNALKT